MTWKNVEGSTDQLAWDSASDGHRQLLLVAAGGLVEVHGTACIRYPDGSLDPDGRIANPAGTASVRQDPSLEALADKELWAHMAAVAPAGADYWRASTVVHHGGYQPPVPPPAPVPTGGQREVAKQAGKGRRTPA